MTGLAGYNGSLMRRSEVCKGLVSKFGLRSTMYRRHIFTDKVLKMVIFGEKVCFPSSAQIVPISIMS